MWNMLLNSATVREREGCFHPSLTEVKRWVNEAGNEISHNERETQKKWQTWIKIDEACQEDYKMKWEIKDEKGKNFLQSFLSTSD